MKNIHLLGPGTLVSSFEDPTVVLENAGVLWEEDTILEIGSFGDLECRHPGVQLLNARGGIILPGLVNLHHHFYSALARGLDPGVPMEDFPRILDGLWWRLDRALDEESIRVSAALSVAECIRKGCTTVFDHHASPGFVRGSLDLIADEVLSGGIRGVLCYEISDRNSHAEATSGLEENLDFATSIGTSRQLAAMLGLHASFTIEDETLRDITDRRPEGLGIHIHLCEDAADRRISMERYGAAPLERLSRFDLLDSEALLIHGVDLDRSEFERIAEAGATLVHNPESNANNAVGNLDLGAAHESGCRLGLGTDGMSSAMLSSLRAAFLGRRATTLDPTRGFDIIPRLPAENARRAARSLGLSGLGKIEAGAPADLIVLDPPAPTPLLSSNVFGHLVYGLAEASCRHTIADGKILLKDFRHTGIDVEELSIRARAAASRLWEKFRQID